MDEIEVKIGDLNIAIFHATHQRTENLNCEMVRAHFRLPLQ